MKKRAISAILLAALMVFTLAGCGSSSSDDDAADSSAEEATDDAEEESTDSTGETYSFVYLSPSTESEYWQYCEVGMRNAILDLEEEYGVTIELTVQGPATEAETDAYIEAFESVIATDPDVILTGTLVPEATTAKVVEAYEAGIYVNFVSMGLGDAETDDFLDYDYAYGVHYYCDNTTIGETAAQAFLDALEERGIEPVGYVGLHMSVVTESLEKRMQGFVDYLAENAPDIICIDTLYNENDVNTAQSNAENQISTYGDELLGLYGGNNVSGDGIALALASSGMADTIVGIGVDSDSIEIEALEAGNLYAIIVQTPYEQAYQATVNAFEYLLTGENSETEKHIDYTSQVVTQDNMDTEEAQGLLDPTTLANY